MEILNYFEQIKAILWIQNSFFKYLHEFWVFLNYFDTEPFYFALGCFAISFLGYKKGINYLYFLCFSLFANHLAKIYCSMPRPFDFQKDLAFISMKPGLGFPSGGAMGALLIYFCFTHILPHRKSYFFAGLYLLLISFSRVYLGVHFFTDVIGGWALAYFLWKVFLIVSSYLDSRKESQKGNIVLFSVIILTNIICYILAPYSVSNILFPIICSIAFSHLILSPHLFIHEKLNLKHSLVRFFVSIFGVVFIIICTNILGDKSLNMNIVYFAVGLWISFISPLMTFVMISKLSAFSLQRYLS